MPSLALTRGAIVTLLLSGAAFAAPACGPGGGGGSGGSAGADGSAGTGGAAGAAGAAAADGASGAPSDAPLDGDEAGDGSGADGDASPDTGAGGAPDASPDSASDAPFDAPISQFCGDGIRDPVTEECDDGTGTMPSDSCSADCRVQDVLIDPGPGSDGGVPPKLIRRLGEGRHPVAAGTQGFAVAYVESHATPARVAIRMFDEDGTPGLVTTIANDSTTTASANPVVAALAGGKYAVAWTDLNGDGSGPGITLRIVDAAGAAGTLTRLNTTTLFAQRDPDLVATTSGFAAAWVDESKLSSSGRDVKLRTLDAQGAPFSSETTIAGTMAHESHVALASFGGSWAAAWRAASGTAETIGVRTPSVNWSVSVGAPGPAGDRPALVAIDTTQLLLLYSDGAGTAPRLRGAVLDVAAPGSTASFDVAPLAPPYAADPSLAQTEPALARVGQRVFATWRSALVPGDPDAEELWLKEITWTSSGGGVTLDLSAVEIPLPRWPAHQKNDQRRPALAATPLLPGGALATAWDDYGQVFGSIEGTPDVVVELIPVPIVRLPGDGGTGS